MDPDSEQRAESPAPPYGSLWGPGLLAGVKGRIANFTPSWFAVNMGTGISSYILHTLPYHSHGTEKLGWILFGLNAILFIFFLLISLARYICWPRIWTLMLNHNVEAFALGMFAIGFATVGDGVVLFLGPAFGQRFVILGWVIWWIDAVLSISIAVLVPFMMFTRQKHTLSTMTGMWLLPGIAPLVASAAGGIIAPFLEPAHARLTIITSYIILGLALPPLFLIMAVYFQRMSIHKAPPAKRIITVFLPIGPCGQSAFATLQLATALRDLQQRDSIGLGGSWSASDQHSIVNAIYGVSIVFCLFLTGFGFFWLTIATMLTVDTARKEGVPFNMGWWALTFPLGTVATSTALLAKELNSGGLRVVAMILSVAELLLWLFVAGMTLVEAVRGTLFVAPCLQSRGWQPPPRKEVPVRESAETVV